MPFLITDYASISQAIADYTHRSDLYAPAGGTFLTDYFLQGAQEMINKDIMRENLGDGISQQEAYYTPQVITNGVVPVPANYLAPKFFKIADGNGSISTLELKDPEWIYDRYPIRSATSLPQYIARDVSATGSVFIFGPYPDSGYTVDGTYYQAAALLNQTNTTNWMVTATPNMFFAAAMSKAMLFLRDAEGIELWKAVYKDELLMLIELNKAERWGSATMTVDVA